MSSYHFMEIQVHDGILSVSESRPKTDNTSVKMTAIDYLWNKIFSWIYVYFINVILIISLLFLVIYRLYTSLVEKIDYYPDFDEPVEKGYALTIAMFTNNYLPFIGGVPLSIARLKEGLEKKGHTVFIFAPDYSTKGADVEENGIIRFSPLFYYRKSDLIVPVSNIFSSKIQREFQKINPDIVHVHHPFWLGSVGKKLAEKFNKPIVFTYHTRLEQYNHYVPVFHALAGGQIPHMLIRFFASTCDAVIAPTRSAKSYLRNLGIGKLIIVQPTGIDMSTLHSSQDTEKQLNRDSFLKKNEILLFSVFRLSKEKSPYFLLDGIEILSRRTSLPFKCLIAGTGPEEEGMAQYIINHNLEKYVILLGRVSPEIIPLYYSMADIFIFSSRSETQGMVILEAMAGRTPVVAVDSSGISDIVEDGKNGYKTNADLDQWVNRIQLLIEDEEKRTALGKGAFLTAENNSMESMCYNILDMYYEIIDWKKKHPNKVFIL